MADHSKPALSSNYSSFVTELDGRFDDLAVGLDPAVTTATNVPVNTTRWTSAANKWQKYDGTSWNDLSSLYAINISGNAATVSNGVYTTGSYANPSWITALSGSKITGDIAGNSGTTTRLATARNINGVAFDGTSAISVNLNNSLTFNNAGSGGVSGSSFNGSGGLTVSYNTVGAPSTTGTNATGTWGINISGNAVTASTAAIASDIATSALNKIYPIGSVYINATNSTNPATLLGFGTWVAFGAGRVMVGFDAGDSLFNAAEKTGGSKDATLVSHTHSTSVSDPGHRHLLATNLGNTGAPYPDTTVTNANYISANAHSNGYENYVLDGVNSDTNVGLSGLNTTGISVGISTDGISATNANVQPYVTVYMWKRTA